MLDHTLQVGDYVETHDGYEGRIVRVMRRTYNVKLRWTGEIREYDHTKISYRPTAEDIAHRSAQVRQNWTPGEEQRRQSSKPVSVVWDETILSFGAGMV